MRLRGLFAFWRGERSGFYECLALCVHTAAGAVAGDLHGLRGAVIIGVVAAVVGSAFDVGFFLAAGSAGDGIVNTVYAVIEAVAECVTAFFCAVTVDLDEGTGAQIALKIDTVFNVASEFGHSDFSFLFLWIFDGFLTVHKAIIYPCFSIIPQFIEQVFDITKNAENRSKKGGKCTKKFIKNYCNFFYTQV